MVIFNLKRKEAGNERVVIATSKYAPSGVFLKVQQACQVSIALPHYL